MTSARKGQLLAVGALLVAGSALGYVAKGGIEKNLVYYWNAKELLEKDSHGAVVRLGGVVQKGTVSFMPETLALSFRVGLQPESTGPSVLVNATGSPPQMFREGIGVVLEGRYDGKVFNAERVLVKHSNEYRAPKPGETAQEIYGTLVEDK